MYLSAGGVAWNAVSDRATKENFAPVDGQAILETGGLDAAAGRTT